MIWLVSQKCTTDGLVLLMPRIDQRRSCSVQEHYCRHACRWPDPSRRLDQ